MTRSTFICMVLIINICLFPLQIISFTKFLSRKQKFLFTTNIQMGNHKIYNQNAVEKKKVNDFAKAVTFALTFTTAYSRPKRSIAKEIFFPECSESIVVLRKGQSEAIIIGTAHISDSSAKLVQRTIQKVSPDLVMIELDPKRIGKFSKGNTTFYDVFQIPSSYSSTSSTSLDVVPGSKIQRQPNLFIAVVDQIKNAFAIIFQKVSGNYHMSIHTTIYSV